MATTLTAPTGLTVPAHDPLAGDPAEGTIRGMVATIVREAHPLAVILFGSRACGDHRPTSDVDLLVVLPEGTDTRRVRTALYNRLAGAGLPKDILAATPARLAAARGDYSSVLHWARERGVTLYRAEGAPDPTRRSRPPHPPHGATVGATADDRARRHTPTQGRPCGARVNSVWKARQLCSAIVS